VVADRLRGAGFAVATAASDWRLGHPDGALLAALVEGDAAAAAETAPERQAAIGAWRARRTAQAQAGTLALTIGHRDILALPP